MSSQVQAAADALKSAIDRHLQACEAKTTEEDPGVHVAYEALREAAESYDDALFDAFDEVSPFEFSSGPVYEPAEVADERLPARLSVLQRRDFAVRSPDELVAAGEAFRDEDAEGGGELSAIGALELLLEEQGLDAVVDADNVGLHYLGGTTWVLDQDVDDDSLLGAPFALVDEGRLLHRLDEEVIG
jgi:hypothetical protein